MIKIKAIIKVKALLNKKQDSLHCFRVFHSLKNENTAFLDCLKFLKFKNKNPGRL